jgi:hypothetical protein
MNRWPTDANVNSYNLIEPKDFLNFMQYVETDTFQDIEFNFFESHIYLQKLLFWCDEFISKYVMTIQQINEVGNYIGVNDRFYSKSKIIPTLKKYFEGKCDIIVNFITLYEQRHSTTRTLDPFDLLGMTDQSIHIAKMEILTMINNNTGLFGFITSYYYGVPLENQVSGFDMYDRLPDDALVINLVSPDIFVQLGTIPFTNNVTAHVRNGAYFRVYLPTMLKWKKVDQIPDVTTGPIDLTKQYNFTENFDFGELTKYISQMDSENILWTKAPTQFVQYFTTDLSLFRIFSEDDTWWTYQQGQYQFMVLIQEPILVEDEIVNSIVITGVNEVIVFEVS